MRLRWWETLAFSLPLLAAVLIYLSGSWVAGTVVLGVTGFVVASRLHVVERNIPGFHARMSGTILLLRATALFSIYGLLVYGWWVMRREQWTHDRHGLVAFYATAGLGIFLVREILQLGNRAEHWLRGGEGEEAVATRLDSLRDQGWMVVHNVVRDDGAGNVDHFAASPTGTAFAIETKTGRPRVADRGQAISNAIWSKAKFGVRYVDAVLCVQTDAPPEPTSVRHGKSTVWVVGVDHLRDWLETYAAPRARI